LATLRTEFRFDAHAEGQIADKVRLWDPATGRLIRHLADDLPPGLIQISPEGKQLAWWTGYRDARQFEVKVFALKTGEKQYTLRGQGRGFCFRPDAQQFASVGEDGRTVIVNEVANGREVHRWTAATEEALEFLAYSPDGSYLAGGVSWAPVREGQEARQVLVAGGLYVWDARTGKELWRAAGFFNGVAFSPDGQRLACASNERDLVVLREVDTGKVILNLQGRGTGNVREVTFSPDGQYLAARVSNGLSGVGIGGTIRVWDATPLRQ
jgi:WD40 repeat protein